ncbi:MAG: hypothetical protein IJP04_02915, partial [Clostridia bacterium]|nr:hypothetical protein [Clostridia bacterium]
KKAVLEIAGRLFIILCASETLKSREQKLFPAFSIASLAFNLIRKAQDKSRMTFLEGAWGNQSQEQTRRVCDAGTANVARGVSMRKPSGVGHTMPLQRMVSPYIYSIGYSIGTTFLRKYFPQASTSLK